MGEFAVLVLATKIELADRVLGTGRLALCLRHINILALWSSRIGLDGIRMLTLVPMPVVLVMATAASEIVWSAGTVEQRLPVMALPMSVVGVCHRALLLH